MPTLNEYWLAEATIEANATLNNVAMYLFGNYQDAQGTELADLAIMNQPNEVLEQGLSYKTFTVGNQPLDNLQIRYLPVNGLGAKWSLGSVSNDGAGLHTITNFTTARKPTISVYKRGDYHKDYAYGCVCGSTDWAFQLGVPLMCTHTFKGRTNGKTTDVPSGATYPSSVSSPFQLLDYWKWGPSDALVEYGIEGFRKQEVQELKPFMGPLGFYSDINEFTQIESVWTVIFKEGVDVSAIITDQFLLTSAGANTGTARAIDAKILKAVDNTKYIRFYNSSAICIDMRKESVIGQPTRYTGTFLGTSASTTYVVDGVADAFY